jgi:ATP-dependent Lon protease
MLFKHKHLLEELRKKGGRATGEILSMTTIGGAASVSSAWAADEDLSKTWFDCRMVLRVVPEDRAQSPFEATVMTRIHTQKSQGAHVPVWYDPADHSKVAVDYEADLERAMSFYAESRRREIRSERLAHLADQRIGVAWTPIEGALVPIEAIPRPGSGRVDVTEWPVAAVHESADAAVAHVRAAAATYLPPRDGGWDAWFAGHDFRVFQPYGPPPATEGATDAPYIGAAIALAVISALTGHMVRPEVSVTGGLGADGVLLPVASLKDVAHAARELHSQRFIAPAGNAHELGQVGSRIREGMEIVFAVDLREAMRLSLTKHAVKGFQLAR